MSFVNCPNLTMRRAMISKSGNRVALQVWLGARVLLPRIVQVQCILGGNVIEEVAAVLVRLYGPRRRSSSHGGGNTSSRSRLNPNRDQRNQPCIGRSGRAIGK